MATNTVLLEHSQLISITLNLLGVSTSVASYDMPDLLTGYRKDLYICRLHSAFCSQEAKEQLAVETSSKGFFFSFPELHIIMSKPIFAHSNSTALDTMHTQVSI